MKAQASLRKNGLYLPKMVPKRKTKISIRLWSCSHTACGWATLASCFPTGCFLTKREP